VTETEAAVATTAAIATIAAAEVNDEAAAVSVAPRSPTPTRQTGAKQWQTVSDPTARPAAFHHRAIVATTATGTVIATVSVTAATTTVVLEITTGGKMSASVCTVLVEIRVEVATSLTTAATLVARAVIAGADVKAIRRAWLVGL
jgi:hypothetical protein